MASSELIHELLGLLGFVASEDPRRRRRRVLVVIFLLILLVAMCAEL